MKTFRELINEIFDKPYEFKEPTIRNYSTNKEHNYAFKTPKGKYKANFIQQGNTSSLEFNHVGGGVSITGTEKESSHKVFSTVHHLMKDHLAKNPDVTNIHFTGMKDNKSLSRVKFYDHFVNRIANKHIRHDDGEFVAWNIHRNDMK